jgi:hypothetical protein
LLAILVVVDLVCDEILGGPVELEGVCDIPGDNLGDLLDGLLSICRLGDLGS